MLGMSNGIFVIYNPNAARWKLVEPPVLEALQEYPSLEIQRLSSASSEVHDRVRRARRVVVVGGDGSIRSTLAFLRTLGPLPEIGIVPAGTGNNLAGALGLTRLVDPRVWVSIAFESTTTRSIDAYAIERCAPKLERSFGFENDVFVQSAFVGFPVLVGRRYARFRRFGPARWLASKCGTLIYRFLAGASLLELKIREILGQRGFRLEATSSAWPIVEARSFAIFVAGDGTVGGDFQPSTAARLDDGLADVCIIRSTPRSHGYLHVFKALEIPRTDPLEGTAIDLSAPNVYFRFDPPQEVFVDGDAIGTFESIGIRVLERYFRVVVPHAPVHFKDFATNCS
jgi:diacylglycerol kinase family enzyme